MTLRGNFFVPHLICKNSSCIDPYFFRYFINFHQPSGCFGGFSRHVWCPAGPGSPGSPQAPRFPRQVHFAGPAVRHDVADDLWVHKGRVQTERRIHEKIWKSYIYSLNVWENICHSKCLKWISGLSWASIWSITWGRWYLVVLKTVTRWADLRHHQPPGAHEFAPSAHFPCGSTPHEPPSESPWHKGGTFIFLGHRLK